MLRFFRTFLLTRNAWLGINNQLHFISYANGDELVAAERDALRGCLRHLLRPVVLFCLRRSLKLQDIIDELKNELVAMGIEELEGRGEPVSASRLAVMTGVHRKDAASLIGGSPVKREVDDILRRIIGQWLSDKRFCDKNGRPKPIAISGRESEFASLVASVSKELSPYTVLLELERQGFVARNEDLITLERREFVPKKRNIVGAYRLVANDISDIIQAADENTLGLREHPHLHLTTRYDNLTPTALPKIEAWLFKQGEHLHEKARKFISKYDIDLNPKLSRRTGGGSISFGTFSYASTQSDKKNS